MSYVHSNYQEIELDLGDYINVSIDIGKINYCLLLIRRSSNDRPKVLAIHRLNLKQRPEKVTEDNHAMFTNLNRELFRIIAPYKDEIKRAYVERQLRDNYDCTRLMDHTISWFLTYFHGSMTFVEVVEVASSLKTRFFGIRGMSKKEIKAWASGEAPKLLGDRGDEEGLRLLRRERKLDDPADCIMMEEACEQEVETQAIAEDQGKVYKPFVPTVRRKRK